MKALPLKSIHALYPDQKRVLADVEAKIGALFVRCPTLCGFSVQDRAQVAESKPAQIPESEIPDADLYVTEIGLYPKLGTDQYADIYDEITITISSLVNEQPNAFDVLRGRTFARSLQ
ncbi:MAG TPA: hypothetical protein VEB41_01175 [Burkholderiales bacterium]|nr:hypothetical protein [Burkholderiales bacterium]